MKIIFEQTQEDLISLSKNSMTVNRTYKIILIVSAVIVLLSLFSSFMNGRFQIADLLAWVIPVVIFIPLWYFFVKYLIKKQFAKSENRKMMLGKREIELLDDKIKVHSVVSDGSFQWSVASKLTETAKYYFLYLGTRQALIFPKRAFQDENQETEFKALVNAKLAQNQK